jgi:hypothetical protein
MVALCVLQLQVLLLQKGWRWYPMSRLLHKNGADMLVIKALQSWCSPSEQVSDASYLFLKIIVMAMKACK